MENELREAKGYFLEKEIKFEKKQKEVIIKRRQEFNKQQTELDVKEEELREFDDSLSSTFLAFGEAPITNRVLLNSEPGAMDCETQPLVGWTVFEMTNTCCTVHTKLSLAVGKNTYHKGPIVDLAL